MMKSEVVSGPALRPTDADDDGDLSMRPVDDGTTMPVPEGDAGDHLSMTHIAQQLRAAGVHEPQPSPFVMPITEDNYMDVAARMVDLKGVAKPPVFTGREADWSAWRFRFESAMALLDLDGVMKALLLLLLLLEDEIGTVMLIKHCSSFGTSLTPIIVLWVMFKVPVMNGMRAAGTSAT
ncbi:unnamed protein product [Polarella glacialis]|uniref:Uncharacterized protein n=1 Tax=Polarella glacialis TaxID=89957 RepID=A0A813F8I3_POLGL|nr:unnamed protein product [Polarella glacialis]